MEYSTLRWPLCNEEKQTEESVELPVFLKIAFKILIKDLNPQKKPIAKVAYGMEVTRVIYVYLHKATQAILQDYCVPLQHYVKHLSYSYMWAFFYLLL